MLVQVEKLGSSFSLLQVKFQFSQLRCWKCYLLSNVHFGHLSQKSDGYSCVGLCQGLLFYSIFFMSVFVPIPCCFYYNGSVTSLGQELWYLQHCLFCLVLPWLFVVFCVSKWTLRLNFLSQWECYCNFDKDCIEHVDCF
jgi:hypothetical protein